MGVRGDRPAAGVDGLPARNVARGAATGGAAPAAATARRRWPRKPIRIAMIAKSSTNPVFLSARTGAETAAKELSASIGVPDRGRSG